MSRISRAPFYRSMSSCQLFPASHESKIPFQFALGRFKIIAARTIMVIGGDNDLRGQKRALSISGPLVAIFTRSVTEWCFFFLHSKEKITAEKDFLRGMSSSPSNATHITIRETMALIIFTNRGHSWAAGLSHEIPILLINGLRFFFVFQQPPHKTRINDDVHTFDGADTRTRSRPNYNSACYGGVGQQARQTATGTAQARGFWERAWAKRSRCWESERRWAAAAGGFSKQKQPFAAAEEEHERGIEGEKWKQRDAVIRGKSEFEFWESVSLTVVRTDKLVSKFLGRNDRSFGLQVRQ